MVYGIARIAMAIWLFVIMTTATLMFGALLGRVPNPSIWMSAFHFLYAIGIAWSAISGILGILAGAGLLNGQGSARKLAIMAAFLAVSEIPFGTMLGVYTLVIFLP
ncbi:MAG: hypothetical protein NVS9B4_21850 [Candidatus Acidiferrum sp.]